MSWPPPPEGNLYLIPPLLQSHFKTLVSFVFVFVPPSPSISFNSGPMAVASSEKWELSLKFESKHWTCICRAQFRGGAKKHCQYGLWTTDTTPSAKHNLKLLWCFYLKVYGIQMSVTVYVTPSLQSEIEFRNFSSQLPTNRGKWSRFGRIKSNWLIF